MSYKVDLKIRGSAVETLECSTIDVCRMKVREFIERTGIGNRDWCGGTVKNGDGRIIGRISFNGSYWPRNAGGMR